jgi:hypothetical protein
MDSVWAVIPLWAGTYRVVPFNGYLCCSTPFLLVRAPTKRDAVEVYKTLKSQAGSEELAPGSGA